MKLSPYTYAKNCKTIPEIWEGQNEIWKFIETRNKENKNVPHFYYNRLQSLDKKLRKLIEKEKSDQSTK